MIAGRAVRFTLRVGLAVGAAGEIFPDALLRDGQIGVMSASTIGLTVTFAAALSAAHREPQPVDCGRFSPMDSATRGTQGVPTFRGTICGMPTWVGSRATRAIERVAAEVSHVWRRARSVTNGPGQECAS